jgi:TatD DNase family protein
VSNIAYVLGKSLYLNITNRCSNNCSFCVRYKSDVFDKQESLWLDKEPTLEDLKAELPEPGKYKEVVFCGYGEPLARLDIVLGMARYIKDKGGNTRLDTNGQGSLINGRNVLPELKDLIDSISISLNAQDAATYDRLCHSIYGQNAYRAIIDFIKEAKKYIKKVTVTVLNMPNRIDIKACERIVKDLGVGFRVREYYEEEYPEHEKHLSK